MGNKSVQIMYYNQSNKRHSMEQIEKAKSKTHFKMLF